MDNSGRDPHVRTRPCAAGRGGFGAPRVPSPARRTTRAVSCSWWDRSRDRSTSASSRTPQPGRRELVARLSGPVERSGGTGLLTGCPQGRSSPAERQPFRRHPHAQMRFRASSPIELEARCVPACVSTKLSAGREGPRRGSWGDRTAANEDISNTAIAQRSPSSHHVQHCFQRTCGQ